MGKKKVAKQDEKELLQESEAIESAVAKSGAKSASKKTMRGNVYVKSSYNNTMVTITDEKGNTLAWSSAGALGFKGPKKATAYAASKIIEALAEKLRKSGLNEVTCYLQGIGGGRDSAVRSLANQGYTLLGIHDVTGIPHNGPKARKPRRV